MKNHWMLLASALAVVGGLVAVSCTMEESELPPVEQISDVEQLIAGLADASPTRCAAIQRRLAELGAKDAILSRLKLAVADCHHADHRDRLQAVIARLSQPDWRSGLAAALKEAETSQRMLMVFSTIGGVNGFS